MRQIRTFGRHPTLAEMKAYYNRDDVLDFMYTECQIRNVHATFQHNKWKIEPTSREHLRGIINDLIENRIERNYHDPFESIRTIRVPTESVHDLRNPDLDTKAPPGHIILWHGTTADRAEIIRKEGFLSPREDNSIWFTPNFARARSMAVSRAKARGERPVVLQCAFDLDRHPDFQKRRSDEFVFRPGYLAFHSATEISVGKEVTGFDLIFEVDGTGWRHSFEALSGAIRLLDEFEVCYRLKYSGVRSLHLMIPFEALPEQFNGESLLNQRKRMRHQILEYFRLHCGVKRVDRPEVLRLAYSLNEDNGLISLPIPRKQLLLFRPWEANIQNVSVDLPWHAAIPGDAKQKTLRFLDTVYSAKPAQPIPFGLGVVPKFISNTGGSSIPSERQSVLKKWADGLQSNEERTRLEAAWHLMTAEEAIPIEILKVGLSDANRDVRWYLTEALQKHLNAEAIQIILRMMSDDDQFVRISAIDDLVIATQTVDSTALLDALWNAVVSDDRFLSNRRSFAGLMSAVEWIRGPDSGESARAFIKGGMAEIADFLHEAIDRKRPYPQIRNYLQLLQKLCEPDNIVEHPGFVTAKRSLLPQLLRHLGESGAVRDYVLILLKLWQRETVLRETLREFARLLQIEPDCVPPDQIGADEREFFQSTVREALPDVSPTHMARILTAFMLYCSDQLIGPAVKVLLEIGVSETAEVLTQVVMERTNKRSQEIRYRLMGQLAEIGDEAAIPAFLQGLNDRHKEVYEKSIAALVRIGLPAMPHLTAAVRSKESRLSANAARALGKIGDAAVAAEWIETLKDPNADATTRHGAAEALGELRLPAAVPALVETLSDESTWVGHNAAKALRKIGTPEAIQAMEAHTRRKGIRSTALVVAPFVAPPKTANNADMALIPAGEFQMGTHDGASIERPAHTVKLSTFYMDVQLVTVTQYREFIQSTGHRAPDWMRIEGMSPADDRPAVYVNWYDAMAYAEWMGKRLPTEAEWEYAARGGLVGKTYPWGDEQPDAGRANYRKQVRELTPVGAYPPNGYGLYDMAGNVQEWCLDAFDADFYAASPAEDPLSVDDSDVVDGQFSRVKRPRVVRGGSLWSPAEGLRVTNRSHTNPRKKSNYIGFRCVAPVTA